MLEKAITYVTSDIWNMKLRELRGPRRASAACARIAMLSGRFCAAAQCQQKSSALTYLSLLSIVPIAALLFAIAKGFGMEALLEQRLIESLQGQQEAVQRIIGFARALIESTRGGVIAGFGVGLLLWTVIKMLGNIEEAFNAIWEVRSSRTLGRKCSDYLSVMLLCPVLFIASGSITVTLASEARLVLQRFPALAGAGVAVSAGLALLPYLFMWGLFSFLYIFMPNRKVRFVPGLLAGIVAGTAYQVVQFIYIKFQIGIAGYNAVYGGFAALPLFLVWLNTSWTIALFGAAVSRACQSVNRYDFDTGRIGPSHSMKQLLALQAAHAVIQKFEAGESPPSAEEIADRLQVPPLILDQLLGWLVESGILASCELCGSETVVYRPAKSTGSLTVSRIMHALDDCGDDSIHYAAGPQSDELRRRLAAFRSLVERAPENTCLKDI